MVCMDLEFVISACYYVLYIITFIEDIYNFIPETDHVSRVCSVAAAQYLQFLLNVMLFCMLNMFYIFTLSLSSSSSSSFLFSNLWSMMHEGRSENKIPYIISKVSKMN
jgi:hypothetical protein